ncbi:MAG TPA: S41 family peptidase [Bacteroidales bacterium]|nr:S41 family peptidase [Bacteroidales bacterium]
MKNIVLVLVIFLITKPSPGQKMSPQEAGKDFSIFRTALVEAHPGIYRFESKETFDSLFRSIEIALVDSISQTEFYRLLSPVVASIRCGHTKFFPEGFLDEDHLYHYYYGTDSLFPLKLMFSGKEGYVLDSYDQKTDIEKGTEILSINDKPLREIMSFLFQNMVADGRVESSRYLELSNFFPAYYANLIESPGQFRLTLRKSNGETENVLVPATTLSEIKEYEKNNPGKRERNFVLTFPDEKVALVKIKAFYPLSKEDNFKRFLKNSFKEINSRKIQRLVIDLRDNEGGNDRWGALLFAQLTDKPFSYYETLKLPNKNLSFSEYAQMPKFYGLLKLLIRKDKDGGYKWPVHKNLKIQKPSKNPFMGEVLVLVNGFSFSVTSEFAAVAKSTGRAVLVGQETGGTYSGNNSGTFAIVTLPSSRLVLGIPMLGYYMAVPQIQPFDRGVLPDIEISPTIHQAIKGEDIVLDKALHLD